MPAAWSIQAEPMRRVGALLNTVKDRPLTQSAIAAFRERLAMLGWVEGGNLRMDYRFTGGITTVSLRMQRSSSTSDPTSFSR